MLKDDNSHAERAARIRRMVKLTRRREQVCTAANVAEGMQVELRTVQAMEGPMACPSQILADRYDAAVRSLVPSAVTATSWGAVRNPACIGDDRVVYLADRAWLAAAAAYIDVAGSYQFRISNRDVSAVASLAIAFTFAVAIFTRSVPWLSQFPMGPMLVIGVAATSPWWGRWLLARKVNMVNAAPSSALAVAATKYHSDLEVLGGIAVRRIIEGDLENTTDLRSIVGKLFAVAVRALHIAGPGRTDTLQVLSSVAGALPDGGEAAAMAMSDLNVLSRTVSKVVAAQQEMAQAVEAPINKARAVDAQEQASEEMGRQTQIRQEQERLLADARFRRDREAVEKVAAARTEMGDTIRNLVGDAESSSAAAADMRNRDNLRHGF